MNTIQPDEIIRRSKSLQSLSTRAIIQMLVSREMVGIAQAKLLAAEKSDREYRKSAGQLMSDAPAKTPKT